MRFGRRLTVLLAVSGILAAGAYVLWSRGEVANLAGNTEAQAPVLAPKSHAGAVSHSTKQFTNRLARENSPYLLLHAHNPVDWYPWGPEAFEKAKKENKPIFLSIGYSSCYWCHVMERLVFSDAKIAQYMNEHFVNIKVDREERPDIDDVYMTSLSVYLRAIGSSQGGGWPLSMFLTPRGKPFAGGTYFPPKDQQGRIGFPSVIRQVTSLWKNQRKSIERNADLLTAQVRRVMKPQLVLVPVKLDRALVVASAQSLQQQSDPVYGGVDFNASRPDGPKFPVPVKLGLLQYALRREGDRQAAKVLYRTLDRMAAGGIRDHLAGGFHRYSTDRYWHVPHFEKMLYDQAQLADVYVEAFRRTNKQPYRDVAEEIFDFVLREMTDPGGGFITAWDAETDGVEGAYYVWSSDEIDRILGTEDAKIFKVVYGFGDPQRFEPGYVLHLSRPIDEAAEQMKVSAVMLRRRLAVMRKKLLVVRSKRKRPLRDDKVLTGWNGLMIRALARGGAVLGRQDYIRAAEKAARFVVEHARDQRGRLRRSYRAKRTGTQAYLDDYAFFAEGLLALYDATGSRKWLNAARRLTDEQLTLFRNDSGGGFYFSSRNHEALIARTINAYDNVLPSGNSVTVRNLIRLASLTGQEKYRKIAQKTLTAFAGRLKRSPTGLCNLAVALGEYLDDPDFSAAHRNRPKSRDPLLPAAGKKLKR